MDITIAIDGHSSCGKSTVAKELAALLNYRYIDTGAMYRCVTLYSIQNEIIKDKIINEELLRKELENIVIDFRFNKELLRSETFLNNMNVEDRIRLLDVSNMVSPISTIKFVRQRMVRLQQRMGESKRIVMDGRDIGTVVFPNAERKFFMTASVEVRAQRRFQELTQKGENVSFEEIKKNIEERDFIDENRAESPLKQAADAILVDNSFMTRKEQILYIASFLPEELRKKIL